MESVGVGILGSGFMGRTWAATVRRTPGAELVAIAGGRRAPGLAADFNVPALEPDALLADPDVDLVLMLTPPRSHADYAIAAADHGKHVLIEKPMANTAADCDRIVAAARRQPTCGSASCRSIASASRRSRRRASSTTARSATSG